MSRVYKFRRMKYETYTPLQERRIAAGWTQEKLAAVIGMKRTNLSAIENGKWIPGLEVCARLAVPLDCTIDDIARDLGIAA